MKRPLVPLPSLILVILLLATAWPGLVQAQGTAYISDELSAHIRTGKTLQHRILQFLTSGTEVTVLQVDDDGYTLVRTANGTEGWIESRFLMNRPHARERLVQAERRIQQLDENRGEQGDRIRSLTAERDSETQRADGLAGRVAELERELETLREVAAEPLETARRNEALAQALSQEQSRVGALQDQNRALQENVRRDWFLVGAGVSVGSLLLGIILTRIRWRRRQSGWID
ncbi:TIGR04211 family SH3 domain-containing protein [Ectothiorhodospira lacustris]|uniref:TIGR04211 family SH3 domain-containing protein n=1 Tax=Ectothiorhodospira lacustris TaxID=2899127 RepID=UPI001EE97F1C|nr:TIGR04211 family SH3 domain-containing protein [Ectothiorhodospira lacustris]MCG5508799.1 TIGR04211 family SH3 domain-containing protein [Ectothiorhodospira lacustris]MCG5520590.1 TIGR04211 family SH3 domain-containing protein [Ectothiorhodospira lacustris]